MATKPPILTKRERRKMRALLAHALEKMKDESLPPTVLVEIEHQSRAFSFLDGWLSADMDVHAPDDARDMVDPER